MNLLTGRKLLLADDSVTIQKVVGLTFVDEGMQVTTVSDGEQALAKLEEVRPDIVLADIHMPKLSGYQVCERIKGDERFRQLPVMLLVGSFEPFDEEEARRVGADDYLTKPFQSIRQLVSKVSSLLGGSSPPQEEAATRRLPPLEETQAEQPTSHQPLAFNEPSAEEMEAATADTAPLPSQPHGEAQPLQAHEAQGEHSSGATARTGERAFEAKPFDDFNLGDETTHRAQEALEPLTMEEINEKAFEPAGGGPQVNFAARTDDALLDLGDIEPDYSTAKEDDFILDLQDEAFYRKPAADAAQAEEAALSNASKGAAAHVQPDEEALAGFTPRAAELTLEDEFTEAQLAGEEQRAEFAAVEVEAQPQASAATELPHQDSASGAGPLISGTQGEASRMEDAGAAPNASAAQGTRGAQSSQIGLDQLSPEVIDAIARRAVEHLSERVVQEIAWEVVPHLAELLIKRRLEEERTGAK